MKARLASLTARVGGSASLRRVLLGLATLCLVGQKGWANSNTTPGQSDAWAENIGWLNWLPDPANGAEISQFFCSGYAYSANTGWINLGNGAPANGIRYQNNSATDFGVNVDPTGQLRGLAYGANIGWINFEDTGAPAVDLSTGKLSGFAYGSNVGWINLGDASFAVKVDSISPGIDSDGDGIPDAWELYYAGNLTTFTATSDTDGDGQTDLEEYLAGTNPLDPNDSFQIVSYALTDTGMTWNLTWTSNPTRRYRIEVRPDLGPYSAWADSGLGLITPDGSLTTRAIPADAPRALFRIQVVRPLTQ